MEKEFLEGKKDLTEPLTVEEYLDNCYNEVVASEKYWRNEVKYQLARIIKSRYDEDGLKNKRLKLNKVEDAVEITVENILNDEYVWEKINEAIEYNLLTELKELDIDYEG